MKSLDSCTREDLFRVILNQAVENTDLREENATLKLYVQSLERTTSMKDPMEELDRVEGTA